LGALYQYTGPIGRFQFRMHGDLIPANWTV
jgi:hypothetical protein